MDVETINFDNLLKMDAGSWYYELHSVTLKPERKTVAFEIMVAGITFPNISVTKVEKASKQLVRGGAQPYRLRLGKIGVFINQ